MRRAALISQSYNYGGISKRSIKSVLLLGIVVINTVLRVRCGGKWYYIELTGDAEFADSEYILNKYSS